MPQGKSSTISYLNRDGFHGLTFHFKLFSTLHKVRPVDYPKMF